MENEMLFKNTSKLDEQEITAFQNAVMKKKIFTFSIIFALIFVGAGIGFAFLNLTLGIILIVCGTLGGFVLLPYLMKESQKKANQEMLGGNKFLNTYEIYDDHIDITTQEASSENNLYNEVASNKLYLQDIFLVMVYKERLFIFINQSQSFILNFRGMTKGTAGELVEFFKNSKVPVQDNSLKGL